MATQVQTRRGTTAQHSTFTGAAGELTVDTDKKVVVVHDGTTAGGAPLLRENGSQNAVTTGTSTAASFIPTSSTVPTNGVYLPSANSVAISTNGSGRLFVDASGNVGVGVTSPATASFGNVIRNKAGAGLGAAGYFAEGANSDTWFGIYSGTGTGDSAALVYPSTGSLRIATSTGVGVGGFSEKIRITSAGLVGIGNSAPSAKLDLAGGYYRGVNGSSITYLGDGSSLVSGASASSTAIRFDGDTLLFAANSAAKMTLTSGGALGIGATAPPSLCSIAGPGVTGTVGRLLQVYASSASGAGSGSEIWLGWNPSNVNAGGGVTIGGVYNGAGTDVVFSTPTNLSSAPTERARIDSSGRLLVGTSSAGAGASTTTTIIGALLMKSTGLRLISQGGTLDLDLSEGTGIVGHLYVSSTRDSNAAARTNATYFISTRQGNNTAITLLNSNNGSTSGSSFTITNPSANIFRFTDTAAGGSVDVSMSFVGTIAF